MARDPDQDQDRTVQEQYQNSTVQDQAQDQDHQKTASTGLEIKTPVSRPRPRYREQLLKYCYNTVEIIARAILVRRHNS